MATTSARANAIATVHLRYDRVTLDPDLEFYGFERVRDPDLDFYGFVLPTKRRRVKRAEQRRRVRAQATLSAAGDWVWPPVRRPAAGTGD